MNKSKEKVLTTKGVLKYLNISNATFYNKYKPFLTPVGKYGYTYIYKLKDIDNIKDNLENLKKNSFNFDVID